MAGVVGIAAGAVAALLLCRLLKSMLYGIQPDDPATVAGRVLILLLVAVSASWTLTGVRLPCSRSGRCGTSKCVQLLLQCMDQQALLLTLRLAALTTAILLPLALALSAWMARSRSWFARLVEAAVGLPLVLPPTVLGFYLLILLGPATPPGRLLVRVVGHPLAFTFWGLVIGSILYSLPFAVQPVLAGFRGVDVALLESAALLGASRWRVLTKVLLPAAHASVLAAAVLCFAHTVGEFGVVLMLGGSIPGVTRTLSIALYDQVMDGNYTAANHTAIALVSISLAALVVAYSVARPGARGETSGV
jgi:molybdate transport system permease protein